MSDFEIAVGVEDNKIVLKIGRVYESNVDILCIVPIDIQNALDIAEAIAAKAFECRGEIPTASKALKADLAEKHAKKLVPRVSHMLRSLSNKPLQYRAQEVVAACLTEVFS